AFDKFEAAANALNSLPATAQAPAWRRQKSYDYLLQSLRLKYLGGTLCQEDLQQINQQFLDRQNLVKLGQ
ncbi:MAG: hypothetical protein WCG27_09825, partial [Pseudomonadota bacterium]